MMIRAWHGVSKQGGGHEWRQCWLISTSPHGGSDDYVLIAFDDEPHPNWGYPKGSLTIRSVSMRDVRIRRDAITFD